MSSRVRATAQQQAGKQIKQGAKVHSGKKCKGNPCKAK